MKLENIGFYTLNDERAKNTSGTSRMQRCEMLLTGRCNFSCPYCRGFDAINCDCGDIGFDVATEALGYWIDDNLKNIRFSGGEPTLYKRLPELVKQCREGGIERIAISSNGSRPFEVYEELIEAGVNAHLLFLLHYPLHQTNHPFVLLSYPQCYQHNNP